MRINPIQQNQNCLNTNFKGTVTPEVTQIIQNLARHEAKNYVLCLGKGVKADKNILLGVQKYWNAILKKLNEKASQMHSDTIVNIESRTTVLGDISPFNFIFKNQNLGVNLVQNVFIADAFITSESLAGKKLRNDVKNIKPEIIDKEILESAVRNLERELKNDNLSTYSTKYPAIIEYQSQLKNVSKEEAKANIVRLNEAIDNAKAERAERIRIETIEQENLELLDEIFGADKDL